MAEAYRVVLRYSDGSTHERSEQHDKLADARNEAHLVRSTYEYRRTTEGSAYAGPTVVFVVSPTNVRDISLPIRS